MFLIALMEHDKPPIKVTAVLDEQADKNRLLFALPPDAIILLKQPSKSYSLKNGKSTYYVCKGQSCLPPTNDLQEWL